MIWSLGSLKDADSLRFLWKEDINSSAPPSVFQMLVHIFGAKDSPTCANYAIKRVARDNFAAFDPLTMETALKAFYVDDLLKSVTTPDVAIALAKQLIELLKRGGMHLTKFFSNSEEVLAALPPSELSPSALLEIEVDGEKLERALGVSWDTVKDVFTFITKLPESSVSKRGILKTTATLFDPIGFLIPFILLAKILLQELWRRGCGWDEEIPEDCKEQWRKWKAGAARVPSIQIARCYNADNRQVSEIQLHVFCDASELAFGCVAYLRLTLKDGDHVCTFVMSKNNLT